MIHARATLAFARGLQYTVVLSMFGQTQSLYASNEPEIIAAVDPSLFILLLIATVFLILFRKQRFRYLHIVDALEQRHAIDMDMIEQLRLELDDMTTTDPLTGLGNRRYLAQVMEREVARTNRDYNEWLQNRSFSPTNADLIFMPINIDHFTTLNDSYGLEAGNRILQDLRLMMHEVVRDTDFLIRLEDDTFLAVFRQANRDSGPFLAERLRRAIENHTFEIGPSTLQLTVCIGFASYPFLKDEPHHLSWQEVLSIAETSLKLARAGGRNAWYGLTNGRHCPKDNLPQRISEEAEVMIARGQLKNYSSRTERQQRQPSKG